MTQVIKAHRAKTVVIKIGSSSLVGMDGSPRPDRIDALASQLARLRQAGHRVVLVSSGAVATGRGVLGWGMRQLSSAEQRAAAAVGQAVLTRVYELALAGQGLNLAQVLVTRTDIAKRTNYVAFGETLRALIDNGLIPVLNENDTLADPALSFTDNDALAAMVAGLIQADCLLLLTDTAGLFTADPHLHPSATPIPVLSELNQEIMALAEKAGSGLGRGGMGGKLSAADLARTAGIKVVIAAAGEPEGVLRSVMYGEQHGTLILPAPRPASARRHWIARIAPISGKILIDEGAAAALLGRRASLLRTGITGVLGLFDTSEVVAIARDDDGEIVARGVVSCNALALQAWLAGNSKELHRHWPGEGQGFGRAGAARAVVHRDDLVVLRSQNEESAGGLTSGSDREHRHD